MKDDSNYSSIVGCALYDSINLYAFIARYALFSGFSML